MYKNSAHPKWKPARGKCLKQGPVLQKLAFRGSPSPASNLKSEELPYSASKATLIKTLTFPRQTTSPNCYTPVIYCVCVQFQSYFD